MKATTVQKILNHLTEQVAEQSGNYELEVHIETANNSYAFTIDENTNYEADTEDDILYIEDDNGTQWIATDKIENIHI